MCKGEKDKLGPGQATGGQRGREALTLVCVFRRGLTSAKEVKSCALTPKFVVVLATTRFFEFSYPISSKVSPSNLEEDRAKIIFPIMSTKPRLVPEHNRVEYLSK